MVYMNFPRPSMVCSGTGYPYNHEWAKVYRRRWYWPWKKDYWWRCMNGACNERRVYRG